ncbi:universal stress protein [Myroides marinus]|uniref:universal stress protein n=2 Tax=Myroides marinus TaxID=703342 RepID=UPI0025753568|nr:universal stress protein [Myroides marinus]MDM1368881.1 universal stress protein [Myroides marinus]MDM1375637.1 universal stress protein [Myroides marinus]MDM1382863.1 universal stress protein [Myroides marinus]
MEMNKKLDILIGLDLSIMDQFLLKYMQVLDQILDINKATYVHNLKLGELPKELMQPESISRIKERIENKLTQYLHLAGVSYDFEVIVTVEGYTELAFMNLAKKATYDLLVLGNKQELEGTGALSDKLVRIFPSSILLVPDTFNVPITTIIDAIDFSKYTSAIMSWADRFKNNSKGQRIEHSAVYISKSYLGSYPTMTTRELERVTREDIREKQDKWNKRYANYSDIDIVPAGERNVSASLIEYARSKEADLLILGVKGTTGFKEIFLGSVANHLLHRPTNTCLLFVKHSK